MDNKVDKTELRNILKAAAWTVCLLAEVLKEREIDWSAASDLANALESEAADLKSLAWKVMLLSETNLDLQ